MIKENQRLLNHLNQITDGILVVVSMLLAYWVRFQLLDGIHSLPFIYYVWLGIGLVPVYLFTYAAFGLYESFRRIRFYREIPRILSANLLDISLLFVVLFTVRAMNFSRWCIVIFFVLNVVGCTGKRAVMRLVLRHYRRMGYNQKHVLIVGDGEMAQRYLERITVDRNLGYHPIGYVSNHTAWSALTCLGDYTQLESLLEDYKPDEVVVAVSVEDYGSLPAIIHACEKSGTKLSMIPFFASFMPSNPQIDDLDGIPLINLRRIPLDNIGNAFLKRSMDIIGAALLLVLTSPIMLLVALGVKCSSPGPVIFKQERVGKNKKPFYMYKFRSMRVNEEEKTGWSTNVDSRKTRFGAFIRKCSLDELPQFFNVLKGDMSLVGPRPEVPFYVERFKEEIPLYMLKHQVRPGITGWAQVCGLRGDTSIKARIEHDLYYIEHWSLLFDLKILCMTLFKLVNQEKISAQTRK